MEQDTRFCDVCLIARDVVRSLEEKENPPYPVPLLRGILPIIKERLSIDGPYDIIIQRRDWKSVQIRSTLFRYRKHATIEYSSDLNLCWARFSICKEAAHLLIDSEEGHFTLDVINLIQKLITSAGSWSADTLLESELMGVVAAVEILLPWKTRGRLFRMRDEGFNDFDIAEYCRVPEKFINLLLRSDYGVMSQKVNEGLNAPQ